MQNTHITIDVESLAWALARQDIADNPLAWGFHPRVAEDGAKLDKAALHRRHWFTKKAQTVMNDVLRVVGDRTS